jgi:plasmid segregation protein ParM
MILGCDLGNGMIKVAGERGVISFVSTLGEYRERNLKSVFSQDDLWYEYEGRKGFAGTLALHESNFKGAVGGSTKAHEDTLIRLLLAISKYDPESKAESYKVVVGQPISTHTEAEKARIKKLIKKDHIIKVNDQERSIKIKEAEVSAEGGVAFWSAPKKGLVRILDFGSATVNGATLIDGKYIDKDSFTYDNGMNTANDLQSFMRAVFIECQYRHWSKSDRIFLVGGSAKKMQEYASNFFENVELLYPILNQSIVDPIYANAIGMYNIAKEIYKS